MRNREGIESEEPRGVTTHAVGEVKVSGDGENDHAAQGAEQRLNDDCQIGKVLGSLSQNKKGRVRGSAFEVGVLA